jgi:hypothetical protein
MNREKLEKQALDIVAGRTAKPAAPKQGMSGIAKLSMWLWLAAVLVIGALAAYVYLLK